MRNISWYSIALNNDEKLAELCPTLANSESVVCTSAVSYSTFWRHKHIWLVDIYRTQRLASLREHRCKNVFFKHPQRVLVPKSISTLACCRSKRTFTLVCCCSKITFTLACSHRRHIEHIIDTSNTSTHHGYHASILLLLLHNNKWKTATTSHLYIHRQSRIAHGHRIF